MILTIYYKPFKLLNVENKTDVAVWLMTMVVVGGTGGLAGDLEGGGRGRQFCVGCFPYASVY